MTILNNPHFLCKTWPMHVLLKLSLFEHEIPHVSLMNQTWFTQQVKKSFSLNWLIFISELQLKFKYYLVVTLNSYSNSYSKQI